ncbi:uncharacterized protein LOC119399065 [Rhipicephalus sanguineus]|uniref:uncharacterized protein LOC119399065 n=1 Tax=Rhipicephalus sanguineus TaxID=34632 RepID=UPI0020C25D32|nr:uncharacterized protein LOC119399065 [Rhipicephalus sanguineus]
MLPPGVRQSSRSDVLLHGETKNVWELRFAYKASPRPPYLTATDYVFYVKRQTQRENNHHHNHHNHQNGGGRSLTSSGGGEQPALSPEDAMVELTNFTELMRRLKEDLRSSYSSFVEEFVSEPNDGVTLLLDLLKTYRRSMGVDHGRYASTRARQQQAKKAQRLLSDTQTSSKTSDTEDSDQSDAQATDSGRSSFLEYSTETEQPAGEEVLIDVPTIRPPDGFQSDSDDLILAEKRALASLKISSTPKAIETKNTSSTLPCISSINHSNGSKAAAAAVNGTSHDSDGSSDKDDVIDWNYPALPEPKLFRKNSRSASRGDASDEKPRVVGVHRFVDSATARRRSKSEDRRKLQQLQHLESTHEIISNGILLDRSKEPTSLATLFRKQPNLSTSSSALSRADPAPSSDDVNKKSTSPPLDKLGTRLATSTNAASKNGSGKTSLDGSKTLPGSTVSNGSKLGPTASFPKNSRLSTLSIPRRSGSEELLKSQEGTPVDEGPFPAGIAAYKANFILRGHGNCGLYSGATLPKPKAGSEVTKVSSTSPPVPRAAARDSSTEVHREIADAVRQIGGWL